MRDWVHRVTLFDVDGQVIGDVELATDRGKIQWFTTHVPGVAHALAEPGSAPRHINATKTTPERTPPMPCRSDYMEPSAAELAATQKTKDDATRAELDRLTRENDQLREMVLTVESGGQLTEVEVGRVSQDQIKHRKADLARLEKLFIEAKDIPLLEKVWNANPLEPLAPQLGFDPDDY